jgi:transposase
MMPADARRGRRWSDHRMVINGIMFRTRTGCPWRDLPGEYGHWKTAYNRHRRWSLDGTWQKILDRLRAGPVPGPALHRDRPPRRTGDGRPGHLRHHRRPGQRPHRHPGPAPGPPRPAATAGTRHDPAHHPGDQAAARHPHYPAPAPVACHPLGRVDPPPPGPRTMVPQTRQARPPARIRPGQTVKCGCLSSRTAARTRQ